MGSTEVYYVDAKTGQDTNDGTSKVTAWQNVSKIKDVQLKPGDRVLFKSGQTFNGQLVLKNQSGTAEQPIRVGAYGQGPQPVIAARGAHKSLEVSCAG